MMKKIKLSKSFQRAPNAPELPDTPFQFICYFVNQFRWWYVLMVSLEIIHATCGIMLPYAIGEMIRSVTRYADDFIAQMREGYDSLVGERGVKLSGGQRQRIAIARVILKNAPILILDEATSSLDSITEKAIQDTLDTAMNGKTVIVVAHRLSTIAHLDRILVFDQGRIIEDGTHSKLLAKGGAYHRLWQMQAGGFLPVAAIASDS